MGKKNIYKKSLAMELIKRGHDFSHSMKNRNNPFYQVYVFNHTKELDQEIAKLTEKNYVPDERAE